MLGGATPGVTGSAGQSQLLNLPAPAANLGGTLAGGGAGGPGTYSDAFGGKPAVPNPAASAAAATEGNLANYPALDTLASQVDKSNLANVLTNVGANIPNYTGLVDQRSQNIKDQLAGVVPQDVQNLLQDRAAELGVSSGMPGAPAIDYADLESLGLTSIGQKEAGAKALGSALSTMPNVPIMDPTQSFTMPSDIQSAQYAANVIGAAPDPTTAANTAFDRMLQIRALDAAEQEAAANRDFERMKQLAILRAQLQPRQVQPGYPTPTPAPPGRTGGSLPNYGPGFAANGLPYTTPDLTIPGPNGASVYNTNFGLNLSDITGGVPPTDPSLGIDPYGAGTYYDPSLFDTTPATDPTAGVDPFGMGTYYDPSLFGG